MPSRQKTVWCHAGEYARGKFANLEECFSGQYRFGAVPETQDIDNQDGVLAIRFGFSKVATPLSKKFDLTGPQQTRNTTSLVRRVFFASQPAQSFCSEKAKGSLFVIGLGPKGITNFPGKSFLEV